MIFLQKAQDRNSITEMCHNNNVSNVHNNKET